MQEKDTSDFFIFRYGIYTKEERNDTKLILNRSFGCGNTIKELSTILSLPSCNVDETDFLRTIDQQLCLKHCSEECQTEEDSLKLTRLLNVLTDMCNTQDHHEDALTRGIVESIHYISDDFDAYLKTDYLTTLTLIFLRLWQMKSTSADADVSAKSRSMKDIFTSKTGLRIDDDHVISQDTLQSTLAHVPILQRTIEDRNKTDEITVYELLDGYRNLNAKQLFKWRFKNEPFPTFNNENLVKKYGYQETLTYGYYLKEGRPNMAVHSLTQVQTKLLGNVSTQRFVFRMKNSLFCHLQH